MLYLTCSACGLRVPLASGYIADALREDPEHLAESTAQMGWEPDRCPDCGAKPQGRTSRYRRPRTGDDQ